VRKKSLEIYEPLGGGAKKKNKKNGGGGTTSFASDKLFSIEKKFSKKEEELFLKIGRPKHIGV